MGEHEIGFCVDGELARVLELALITRWSNPRVNMEKHVCTGGSYFGSFGITKIKRMPDEVLPKSFKMFIPNDLQ